MTNLEFYKEEITKDLLESNAMHIAVYNAYKTHRGANSKYVAKTTLLDWLCEEHVEPILDDVEKEYLKNVIKPFRENIENIVKWNCNNDLQYLTINLSSSIIRFPAFKKGTKYKNMELNKNYILEELDL